MMKRVAVLGAIGTSCILIFIFAANVYPDATLKAIESVRELGELSAALLTYQEPPKPPSVWGFEMAPEVESDPAVLSAGQIVAIPQVYAHQLVVVHGCYVSMFELSALLPCREANRNRSALSPFGEANENQFIWVQDAGTTATMSEWLATSPRADLRRTAKSSAAREPSLLFHFDKTRHETAWRKLEASRFSKRGVTLIGQFETGGGFGHLNAFRHELLLMDVIDNQPPSHIR